MSQESGGGKPAMDGLRHVVRGLSQKELLLAQQALFLGRAINEYQETFARGDFLINSIVGFDPKTGSIAISSPVQVGSTVQFHVSRPSDSFHLNPRDR